MNGLEFRLDVFEGPLDLLLSLIAKNKVNICDIPISLIFEQYMAYLDEMRMMDMDIAGEFISMTSELMLIKSRLLLPKPETEDGEDPRAALASALLEYKKIKEAARCLGGMYDKYGGRFAKEPEDFGLETILLPHDADMLLRALKRIINRSEADGSAADSGDAIQNLTGGKAFPVASKIIGVIRMLYKYDARSFDSIMEAAKSRSEIIASFLAVLELLKVRRILMDCRSGEILFRLNRVKSERKADKTGDADITEINV